jgi:hypothetical protein
MAAKVAASAWSDTKRKALEGPARRLWEWLDLEGLLDGQMTKLAEIMLLYADARLSAPLAGWQDTTPPSVLGEVSRLGEALRDDGATIGPCGGALCRGYLIARGARRRPGHSNKYPVTPHMLAGWENSCLTEREHLIWGAAVIQSYFALRAGYTARVRREELRRTCDGWLLEWRQPHKTRRADPLRPAAPHPAQSSAARGPMLDRALALAAPVGILFPTVSAHDVTLWLRARVGQVPDGFSVSAHGIRAGTDIVLQCLGVPDDIIAQWGWWSRQRRMTGYYGGIPIAVCLVASDLFPIVQLVNTCPGMYDLEVPLPPLPKWSKLRRVADVESMPSKVVAAGVLAESDDDDSEEDSPGALAPVAVRRRLRGGGAGAARTRGAAAPGPTSADGPKRRRGL